MLGQFSSFLQKNVLLIILLPLDKMFRFLCSLFTFVSTYVFNTESLNQEFFQKIWVNLLVLCVLRKCV